MEVIQLDIVDRIFELVDAKYKEQQEFASELSLDPTIPSRWRKRKSTSYQKYLPQIATALNTTTEYLLTGTPPGQAPYFKGALGTTIETPQALLQKLDTLSAALEQLNEEGQEKLLDYAADLVASGRYKKADPAGVGQKA